MDQPTPKDKVQEAHQGEQGADWTNYQLHLPEADTKACKTDKPSAASGLVKPDDIVLSFDEPSCDKKGGDLQTLTDSSQILPIYTGVDDSGKPIDKVDNSDAQESQTEQDSQLASSDVLQQAVDKRLGQSLDVANRRLGCTTAVSQVLNEIDPDITVTSNNRAFARDLEAHGYERVPLAEIKPGDVIIGKRPDGMPGHSAIYMGDGKVFNNNSNSQQMQIDGVEKFSQGMHDQNGRWNKNGFSETVVYRKAQATSGADDQAAAEPEGDMSVEFTDNAGLDQVKPIRPILDVPSLQLGTDSPAYSFQPGVNLGSVSRQSGDEPTD
ncbi:C40 family peptidase [bacterium]|nr:C40 family peptidase [bacterium]MBP9807141.1 C40 family peptidase [bacterium]